MVFPRLGHRIRRVLTGWFMPCLWGAALLAQLLLLRGLDYSKAWFSAVAVQDALVPRDPLALGGLRWDPAPYVHAPELDSFRAMVNEHCAGRAAFETAVCLSDLFAVRFRQGEPDQEFFQKSYDPAAALARHLAGRPGHCVTRSGLMATALLSAGFPARVVQL